MKKLYLVRHAETVWNSTGRIQGGTNIGLSGAGMGQTCRTVRRLCSCPIDIVLTSPLRRARVLAAAVAHRRGVPLVQLPQLRERSFGEWEGLTWEQVHSHFEGQDESQEKSILIRPEGGESIADVFDRAYQVREYLSSSPFACGLIVAHGAFNCVLITALLELPMWTFRQFAQPNACVSLFQKTHQEKWQILFLNSTCHLLH